MKKKLQGIKVLALVLAVGIMFLSLPALSDTVQAQHKVQTMQKAAKKQNTRWNIKKKLKMTKGAFTYHAIASRNGKEAWICYISVKPKKRHATLQVPAKIGGKKVTRLGFSHDLVPNTGKYDECYLNIFGVSLEPWHGLDGDTPHKEIITKIVLPDSIQMIERGTFSGLDDLKSIKLPKQLKTIEDYLFYGCKRLEKVTLSVGLKQVQSSAFEECPKLKKLVLPSQNKTFLSINGCVVTQKDKTMVLSVSRDKVLEIPEGVERINEYALAACKSEVVHIPASVRLIENAAFHMYCGEIEQHQIIKDVTISENNEVYAKDGQCIYHKKDFTLAVAMVDQNGVIRVSDEVRHLKQSYSVVSGNAIGEGFYAVVFPKQLETVIVPGFGLIGGAGKVCFTGENPPTVDNPFEHISALPIFSKIYVPQASYEKYKAWYKAHDCWNAINGMFPIDPDNVDALLFPASDT